MWTIARVLLVLLGLAGSLLCGAGIVGAFRLGGGLSDGVGEVHGAVDDVLRTAEEGVAQARPEVLALRARLAGAVGEAALERAREELADVTAFLERVSRAADSAAGLVEAADRWEPDRATIEELRRAAEELRRAAERLAGLELRVGERTEAGPLLVRAEMFLANLERDLAGLRTRAADVRETADGAIRWAVLAVVVLMAWMALGQLCLARTGLRRRRPEG
jgi:hypothetical protein